LAPLASCENSFNGLLTLTLADTPADGVQHVVLAVTGVDVGSAGGRTGFAFTSEIPVDVAAQQGFISFNLLTSQLVPAGKYEWVQLDVDPANSYVIASNGGQYPLAVPRALRVYRNFMVGEGLLSNEQVDVDLHRSLAFDAGGAVPQYVLAPDLKLIDLDTTGSVVGLVANTLQIAGLSLSDARCQPAAYVYTGQGVVPEGYDVMVKGGTAPMASGTVSFDSTRGLYVFVVAYLPPGLYTTAVTSGALDAAGASNLTFSPVQTFIITVGQRTVVQF